MPLSLSPLPDFPPQKKYYTIGEVAQLLQVAPSLIRFWEKKFPSLRPQKTPQGIRQYTAADIATLQRIHGLVKEQGYTLKGAQEVLQQSAQAPDPAALIRSLKELRAFLVGLQGP